MRWSPPPQHRQLIADSDTRVWTALHRGIHSKEWLVQSLKEGKLSKKNAHDVYCSRCGHLTAFRDPSGDEGGMHHISHATVPSPRLSYCHPSAADMCMYPYKPYDRATRTFGKRDAVGGLSLRAELDRQTSDVLDRINAYRMRLLLLWTRGYNLKLPRVQTTRTAPIRRPGILSGSSRRITPLRMCS